MIDKSIRVQASSPYDILVGEGVLKQVAMLVAQALPEADEHVLLVSDSHVGPLYASNLVRDLSAQGFSVQSEFIEAGEQSKSLTSFAHLLGMAAEAGLSRSSTVIALGGGVVGDLAGFVAASYMRGCNLVQIPTSLLAMVDSSVGGKTAIDLTHGKNLVGAFYQPALVVCDPLCLKTLPAHFVSDGMGEVIKYAILSDPHLFERLNKDFESQASEIIVRCIDIKRSIVEADERESGCRKLLNLGHTLGHAVEKLSAYSVTHGMAVGIGLAYMARACAHRGLCSRDCVERIENCLLRHGLDISCDYEAGRLIEAAYMDKKRRAGYIDIIAIRDIGTCEIMRMDFSDFADFVQGAFHV